jgi:hypothetical protein
MSWLRIFLVSLRGLSAAVVVLCLVSAANVSVRADSATNRPQPPVMIKATLPAPPNPFQVNSNYDIPSVDINGGAPASNTVPHDTMEVWLLQKINGVRLDLQRPGLDANSRQFLENSLARFKRQWADHQAQVQSNKLFIETIRSNPRTGFMTNRPDPIEQSLKLDIAHYERELDNPALPSNMRKIYEGMLDDYKQKLADHETNAQLWVNLRLARQSKNEEQMAYAERELADYLGAKIGMPPGKTLEAVMKEYRIKAGTEKPDRRKIILGLLIFVMVSPLVFFVVYHLRHRR